MKITALIGDYIHWKFMSLIGNYRPIFSMCVISYKSHNLLLSTTGESCIVTGQTSIMAKISHTLCYKSLSYEIFEWQEKV